MALGYDRPLYLIAFDHRGSFEHGLFGATPAVAPAVHAGLTDAKEVIFDAHLNALTDGARVSACGIATALDGFAGFACGRTLWQEALQDYLAGRATRQDAINKIAARYHDMIDADRSAEALAASSTGGSP